VKRTALPALLSVLLFGCQAGHQLRSPASAAPAAVVLGAGEIAELIPARYRDRAAWGDAIANALAANSLPVDKQSACAVIAVIAQESGFEADPVVPGMAKIAASRIDRYKDRLGPIGEPLFRRLLAGRAPDDARSFQQRLATVRTERDVDLLFRDILAYYEVNHPVIFTAANLGGKLADVGSLADLNPITTAGPMQVSVRFAEEWARARKGKTATSATVRESLYTRAGGVYYGTARLLAYPVRYDDIIYRFADYNAGVYASRNAAVQSQLTQLTGKKLVLDGDLLSYEKDGSARDDETESMRALQSFAQRFAPDLSPRQLRRDLQKEKTLDFEDTATYRALKTAVAPPAAPPAPYASLPQVAISSPKFTRTRSTAWFARAVQRRYHSCLAADGDR
jgi:hypothetical protein